MMSDRGPGARLAPEVSDCVQTNTKELNREENYISSRFQHFHDTVLTKSVTHDVAHGNSFKAFKYINK